MRTRLVQTEDGTWRCGHTDRSTPFTALVFVDGEQRIVACCEPCMTSGIRDVVKIGLHRTFDALETLP